MLLKVGTNLPKSEIVTVAIFQISFLIAARWIVEQVLCAMIVSGGLAGRKVVVIGEPAELVRLSSSDLFHYFGLKEIGRVPVAESATERSNIDAELESLDRGLKEAREKNAEEIVVALRWSSKALLERVRDRMRATPLPVRLLPDSTIRSVLGRRSISAGGPVLSVEIQRAPLTPLEQACKRALDIALSAIAILILSPLLIGVAIAIKLDSSGPIIFRQRRNGFNSLQFVIFKFRTMTVCEDGAVIQQAHRGDRRVTRVGKFLRRSSIDELPQLFNVLFGNMSLVGPRPHALAHDDEYKSLIAKYAFRHHVKPGMTGWAQVNGLRGETGQLGQMIDRIKLDLWYINHWSFGFDLNILVRTCIEVFRNRAY
jgi:undecaprenyl-phosphate galactose phosphotransferase/putative colanic acid biosynthesis UDP-glucose lipid carrier transferase